MADHSDDAYGLFAALLEVEGIPSSDLHSAALGVDPFSPRVGIAMGGGITALESTSVLSGSASLSRRRRRGSVEHAIPRDPQQPITRNAPSRLDKGGVAVPSVPQAQRRTREQGNPGFELLSGHFRRSLFRLDSLIVQDRGPTGGLLREEDNGGEAPSGRYRSRAGWKIVNVLGRAVPGRGGGRASDRTGIDPQNPPFALGGSSLG